LWSSLGTAVGAVAILIWMIAGGPGFLGFGASLLWTGPHRDKPALYDLRVTPGDAVVRRHADQMVSALPIGLRSPSVKLHARYQSSSKWEEIAMQSRPSGSFAGGYEFLFAGLPENVEYYVTAGAMTSKHFNIRVSDLPAVKQIRVTYHYPAWTGMPTEVEERGGDAPAAMRGEGLGGQAACDTARQDVAAGAQVPPDHQSVRAFPSEPVMDGLKDAVGTATRLLFRGGREDRDVDGPGARAVELPAQPVLVGRRDRKLGGPIDVDRIRIQRSDRPVDDRPSLCGGHEDERRCRGREQKQAFHRVRWTRARFPAP